MRDIRGELERARRFQGISYIELGLISGVHHNTCYRFLMMGQNTGIENVEAIANALGYELALEESEAKR